MTSEPQTTVDEFNTLAAEVTKLRAQLECLEETPNYDIIKRTKTLSSQCFSHLSALNETFDSLNKNSHNLEEYLKANVSSELCMGQDSVQSLIEVKKEALEMFAEVSRQKDECKLVEESGYTQAQEVNLRWFEKSALDGQRFNRKYKQVAHFLSALNHREDDSSLGDISINTIVGDQVVSSSPMQ